MNLTHRQLSLMLCVWIGLGVFAFVNRWQAGYSLGLSAVIGLMVMAVVLGGVVIGLWGEVLKKNLPEKPSAEQVLLAYGITGLKGGFFVSMIIILGPGFFPNGDGLVYLFFCTVAATAITGWMDFTLTGREKMMVDNRPAQPQPEREP